MKQLTLTFAAMLLSISVLHADRPNVLFIAVDDLRPELGCYGNKIVKTPNIDRLASRGIVFNLAYCQQAVCSPSRTAMLTGLRPDVTKVWDLETHFRAAQPDCITLPQHFKANGYHCAALSKIYHAGFEDGRSWNEPHWYPKGRAVDTDLIDYTKQTVTRHDVDVEEFAAPLQGGELRKNGKAAKKGPAFEISPKADDELPDGATAAEAVRRLQTMKSKSEPFFLAVGFLKPHLPFVAPKKYWDLYDPRTIPLPAINHLPVGSPEFAGHTNSELHAYPGVPKANPIPDDFARQLRQGYYACISYTDAQIGRLLDALDAEGLADNTIIVLWGDHGWQLGDHGLWHKHTNFELATRAPLLISVPNTKTAGQKCEAPVEFVDVYPTLADLCGLPAVNGLTGTSLKPFIEKPAAPMQKVAISQYPRSRPEGAVMGYSIRDERWRGTFWRERNGEKIVATELYDEQTDPAESINLADKPENQQVLDSLRQHLPVVGSAARNPKVKKESGTRTAIECEDGSAAVQPESPDPSQLGPSESSLSKPNIIFILADDLGIGNRSCYGSDKFKTPHIDKLATEGTRFTRAFTAPLCGPSRALILSGRYAFRTGATNQDACGLMPRVELRMPNILKSAGYTTSAIGKWGQLPGEPGDAGFDDYLRFNGSGVYGNSTPNKPERYSVNGAEKRLGDNDYMPDVMHEHLINFVTKHQSDPFFVYYSLSHVHGELVPTPDSQPGSKDLMADNMAYMDKLVGKLVAELERLKLRENTLIVFMGDNGTGKGNADEATIGGRQLSGMKGSMLECGALVPMIANWPSHPSAGMVCSDLIDSTDLLPTFTQLAGAKLPTDAILDDHNFANVLLNEPGKPRDWVFLQLARMWYVREANWKLNEKGELFDMSDAPFAETLIAFDTLDAAAVAARVRLQATLAELNPSGGMLDTGDGTGRHAGRARKK